MRRLLNAAEMREADRVTIEDRGLPSLVLMESAARAVTGVLLDRFRPLDRERVLILCGKGNNGGDGLAIARQLLLYAPKLDLCTAVLAEPDALSPDAATNWTMLAAQDHRPRTIATRHAWSALLAERLDTTVIVDALLGTGIRGPVRGLPAHVIADVNRTFRNAQVVAVDMPSGLNSDSGTMLGPCMRADCTVTFTAPKPGQVLPPASEHTGDLRVARIGTADTVVESLPGPRLLLSERADVRELLAPRDNSSHKGSFGHVLAIGGSHTKPGAILMTGSAALRAGAGLATVVTAAGASDAILAARPEIMLEPAETLEDGTLGPAAFTETWFSGKSVVAVGPGLGNSERNQALVRKLYCTCPLPLVLDADGLAMLQEGTPGRRAAPTVLTPHPGEMARLVGSESVSVQRDRLQTAREYATKNGVYVVLKGNRTLIAAPDGDTVVNPTGTPGMATAGSGDILTGMVAALLAQFPAQPVLRTVAAAVYLHGLAGELATQELGEQGMLATDLLRRLPDAIQRCHEDDVPNAVG